MTHGHLCHAHNNKDGEHGGHHASIISSAAVTARFTCAIERKSTGGTPAKRAAEKLTQLCLSDSSSIILVYPEGLAYSAPSGVACVLQRFQQAFRYRVDGIFYCSVPVWMQLFFPRCIVVWIWPR